MKSMEDFLYFLYVSYWSLHVRQIKNILTIWPPAQYSMQTHCRSAKNT